MDFDEVVLWIQLGYALWQFVRVAKVFRIPYGILNSILACSYFFFKSKSRIILPFQKIKYTPVSDPSSRDAYFINSELFELYGVNTEATNELENGEPRGEPDNARFTFSNPRNRLPPIWNHPDDQESYEDGIAFRECRLRFNGEDFSFLLKGKETFLLTICRDEPKIFCAVSDMIIPGFSIVEPMNQEDALNKIICEGYHPLIVRHERVLPIWLVDDELNRNFIRVLSTLPLVAQAKGNNLLSYYFFFIALAVDQLGFLFEKLHQCVKLVIFHVYKKLVSELIRSPSARIAVCEFFSTFDKGLYFCDKYCHNFVQIKKGQEFLVCNTKAIQLGGQMGDFIKHHNPNGDEVASSTFTSFTMKMESGDLQEFKSRECRLYEIGKCKIFIDIADRVVGPTSQNVVNVFCSDICVHSGFIDTACIFHMLNAVRLVAEKGHLPVHSVRGNRAHSININDFISNPMYFLSIQVFRATKNMWIGDETIMKLKRAQSY